MRKFFHQAPRSHIHNLTSANSGMALVVVLAMIVLVTIAAMAFFARATSNRVIEAARANQTLGSQLALTAEDYVLAKLIADLDENATSSSLGGVTLYTPTNGIGTMPPRRLVDSSLSNDTNFASLTQQSGAGSGSHATTDPARNGRAIPPERWNAPRFLFGGSFAVNSVPRWIYAMKDGSTTNAVSSAIVSDVIGRFAYNIYNTSGLLDANLVGNPALTGINLSTIKGTQAGADLTALPGVTASTLADLITFRNPQATDSAAYRNYVTNAASENYRSPVVGSTTNNFFHSRQDLIRYAINQNVTLTNALPYLTTFSAVPELPTAAVDGDNNGVPDPTPVLRPASVSLIRYRDDGTSYSMEIDAGEPLLDHRFALDKLAWLGPSGPNTGQFPALTPAAIQACFGLLWNPSEHRWDYVGPSGISVKDEISSLSDVADDNRDPNFLELLNAGIGKRSLDLAVGRYWGLPGNPDPILWGMDATANALTGANGFTYDGSLQYQVMRIAAAIIDQADADNYPTTLHFNADNFYGLEDLPLISGLFTKVYFRHQGISGTQFGDPPVSLYLIPQLWNPHRAGPVVPGPTDIAIVFENGGNTSWWITMSVPNPSPSNPNRKKTVQSPQVSTSFAGESITVDLSASGDFRAQPSVIVPGPGISGLAGVNPPGLTTSDYDAAVGLPVGVYSNPWPASFLLPGVAPHPAGTTPGGQPNTPKVGLEMSNAKISMRYRNTTGSWRTYAIFGGATGILSPALAQGNGLNLANLYRACAPHVGPHAIRPIDPRTQRFGLAFTTESVAPGKLSPASWPKSTIHSASDRELVAQMGYSYQGLNAFPEPANFQGGNWGNNLPIARLWMNDTATNPKVYYGDSDGVVRPSDGILAGAAANPMYATATGAAGALTASDRTRPIILQRPFRTVAELGYAFRDQPWKTLDFFSDKSADAALLDLFCISENAQGIIPGKINPNAAPSAVLDAILRFEPFDDMDARYPSTSGIITSNLAATLSANLRSAALTNPLLSRTNFPALVSTNHLADATTLSKPSREAGLRAINDLSDFGSWGIFVDIIAQSGKLTAGAAADNFLVEAEERTWLSMTLNRQNGDVVNRKSEHPAE